MDSPSTTSTQDTQVTVPVPEDRVAEFYAFYARFLAGRSGRRGGPWGMRHHHHGCGRPAARDEAPSTSEVAL